MKTRYTKPQLEIYNVSSCNVLTESQVNTASDDQNQIFDDVIIDKVGNTKISDSNDVW